MDGASMSSSARKSGIRTPSRRTVGASSSRKLVRPRRPSFAGRPLRSSLVCNIGALCLRTCQAVRAPDLRICSAVIRNAPGGLVRVSLFLTAGPHPSDTTTSHAVRAFMRGLPVRGRRRVRSTIYSRGPPRASRYRARPALCIFAAMLQLTVLLLVAQVQVPPPRGYVNDFAGVLDAASVAHMEAVIAEVRDKTRGEIAVVTLPDIGDRPAGDVALPIGRQWGVGGEGEAGERGKNIGLR